MDSFKKLGLTDALAEVIDQLGFTEPTPIQEQAIPMLLKKDPTDFIGLAQTGTGKTAAFGLPLVQLVDENIADTQVLVLAPTRELGQQTAGQIKEFAKAKKGIQIVAIYGGSSIGQQIKALKKPTQIIVATPGRLMDLIRRKAVKLEAVRYVVLDEADEMLNMGFKEAIDEILEYTNEFKSTWLFSATMPPQIQRITKKYMSKPLTVAVNTKERSNVDIDHQFVITKTNQKLAAIRRFMDLQPDMRGVLFCRTKRETQEIADELRKLGYGAEALHGDLSQAQRDAVMKRFKNRSLQMLIATDVAARGIDVQDLSHVMHHTLPDQLESYTHRSGRTGRAGKKGISLAFINGREKGKIRMLEKDLKVSFTEAQVPTLASLKTHRIEHWANYIVNTAVDDQSDAILAQVTEKFKDFSKEDILKRLITTQLDHLLSQEEVDFSEGQPARKKDASIERFFINVGSMDGLTKGDLLHLISDFGDVPRDQVGNIDLHKSYSFFDLNIKHVPGFAMKFEGLEVDGRAIRVNADSENKDRPKFKKSFSGSGKRKPQNRGFRSGRRGRR